VHELATCWWRRLLSCSGPCFSESISPCFSLPSDMHPLSRAPQYSEHHLRKTPSCKKLKHHSCQQKDPTSKPENWLKLSDPWMGWTLQDLHLVTSHPPKVGVEHHDISTFPEFSVLVYRCFANNSIWYSMDNSIVCIWLKQEWCPVELDSCIIILHIEMLKLELYGQIQ